MQDGDPELTTARALLVRLVSFVDRGRGGNICSEVSTFLRRTNPEVLPTRKVDANTCAATRHDALMICARCKTYWGINEGAQCKQGLAVASQPHHQPEKQS